VRNCNISAYDILPLLVRGSVTSAIGQFLVLSLGTCPEVGPVEVAAWTVVVACLAHRGSVVHLAGLVVEIDSVAVHTDSVVRSVATHPVGGVDSVEQG
jgi:hypothetical protein